NKKTVGWTPDTHRNLPLQEKDHRPVARHSVVGLQKEGPLAGR
ncbi:1653_t:CDS:1, partial [Ambispora leptoticha]